MPLDPNIAFRALSPQAPSLAQTLTQTAGLAGVMRQQRQEEQLADIFARNIRTTPEGTQQVDRQKALAEVYQVQPRTALEIEQIWTKTQPEPIDPRKQFMEDISLSSQILSGVTDPVQAIGALQQAGLSIEDMPPPGTPQWEAWRQNRINMGIEAKDFLAFKQRELDRERRDKQLDILFAKLGLLKTKTQMAGRELEIKEEKAAVEGRKAIEAHRSMKLKKTSELTSIQEFIDLADSIIKNPNLKFVTGLGRLVSVVPGTPAADLSADLDRLLGMGSIETMAKLKRESPTGATGFGALSAPELKVIQDAFAALGRRQSPRKMRSELTRIINKMRNYMNAINRFEAEGQQLLEQQGLMIETTPGKVVGKYRRID